MYVPLMGAPDAGIMGSLDDDDWSASNQALTAFLGLEDATKEAVSELLGRLALLVVS
jgi:hypothetical protein